MLGWSQKLLRLLRRNCKASNFKFGVDLSFFPGNKVRAPSHLGRCYTPKRNSVPHKIIDLSFHMVLYIYTVFFFI